MATVEEGSPASTWTAFCVPDGVDAIDGDAAVPAVPPPPAGQELLDEAVEVERLLAAMEAVTLASRCEVVGSMYEARATLSAEERAKLERDCYGDLPPALRRRRKEEERCWTVQKEDVVQEYGRAYAETEEGAEHFIPVGTNGTHAYALLCVSPAVAVVEEYKRACRDVELAQVHNTLMHRAEHLQSFRQASTLFLYLAGLVKEDAALRDVCSRVASVVIAYQVRQLQHPDDAWDMVTEMVALIKSEPHFDGPALDGVRRALAWIVRRGVHTKEEALRASTAMGALAKEAQAHSQPLLSDAIDKVRQRKLLPRFAKLPKAPKPPVQQPPPPQIDVDASPSTAADGDKGKEEADTPIADPTPPAAARRRARVAEESLPDPMLFREPLPGGAYPEVVCIRATDVHPEPRSPHAESWKELQGTDFRVLTANLMSSDRRRLWQWRTAAPEEQPPLRVLVGTVPLMAINRTHAVLIYDAPVAAIVELTVADKENPANVQVANAQANGDGYFTVAVYKLPRDSGDGAMRWLRSFRFRFPPEHFPPVGLPSAFLSDEGILSVAASTGAFVCDLHGRVAHPRFVFLRAATEGARRLVTASHIGHDADAPPAPAPGQDDGFDARFFTGDGGELLMQPELSDEWPRWSGVLTLGTATGEAFGCAWRTGALVSDNVTPAREAVFGVLYSHQRVIMQTALGIAGVFTPHDAQRALELTVLPVTRPLGVAVCGTLMFTLEKYGHIQVHSTLARRVVFPFKPPATLAFGKDLPMPFAYRAVHADPDRVVVLYPNGLPRVLSIRADKRSEIDDNMDPKRRKRLQKRIANRAAKGGGGK